MKTDSLTILRQARAALRALDISAEDLDLITDMIEDAERQVIDECNDAWEDGYRARDLEVTREQW